MKRVVGIGSQDPTQMRLAKNDDMTGAGHEPRIKIAVGLDCRCRDGYSGRRVSDESQNNPELANVSPVAAMLANRLATVLSMIRPLGVAGCKNSRGFHTAASPASLH